MTHRRRPLVVSHAACAGLAPENTLAGVRIALELGVDAIEVDVHATADGVPVLLHDDTVDRTTDGSGDVRAMTLDQVRRLDAGARQHEGRFRGEPVPTLAEVFHLTAGRAYLAMEIKQPGIEEQVVDVIRRADAVPWAVFCSFYPQTIRRLRELEPRIPTFLLVESAAQEQPASSPAGEPPQSVFLHYTLVTAEVVKDLHQRGGQVFVWTVDEEAEMGRLVALGVDGIGTNYPDRLLRVLAGVASDDPRPAP
ncbi:MAG: glycerophosphodiester phosphodiesterase [Dehalococcoidia bacterium]